MVENVNINVGTPEGKDFATGIIDGITASLNNAVKKISEGTDETFMLLTIGIMVSIGGLYLWRHT